jgi:exoribonuclease R
MHYTLVIEKSDYTKYHFIRVDYSSNNENIIHNDDPELIKGFFHLDVVDLNILNYNIKLIHRELNVSIAGELELYSKYSFKPNKRGTPAYIFTPVLKNYPKFLVHSNLKRTYQTNIFITIDVQNWEKKSKFPNGNIKKIIGPIDDNNCAQELLLYKYNLDNKNIKCNFKGITKDFLELQNQAKKDRVVISDKIISIDPEKCQDIDDAFTIKVVENYMHLMIHISDVYYLMKHFNLLEKYPFYTNFTSIYLKNKINHMLPLVISSKYGSLLENEERLMLTLNIVYDCSSNQINEIKFMKTYGKITKNYSYENYPKRINKYFDTIEKIYQLVTNKQININNDSHKFIEALMIIYNCQFSKYLLHEKLNNKKEIRPIFRVQDFKHYSVNNNYDDGLKKFLKLINSNSALYSYKQLGHQTLDISNYTHATSPLRRIVDLMNQEIYYNTISKNEHNYFKFNVSLPDVNIKNKKIKKCYREINKIYLAGLVYDNGSYKTKGYIYDINQNDNNYIYIYLPDENISFRTNIIDWRLKNKYMISSNNNNITVKNIESDENKILPLNELIELDIFGKPDVHNIDSSIIIKF